MLLVSNLIEAATAILPPRLAFQITPLRMERWRTFEHGWLLLDNLVDPARAAIDVGANEGYYAGKLAKLTQSVHCFEPIPWFAESLRRKLPTSVIVHPCAVSDAIGTAVLRIPYRHETELHGTSTIEQANSLTESQEVTKIKSVEVQRVSLDSVIREPVGFIKIDVEGHELAVLQGARNIIDNDRPIVLVESERRHHRDAPTNVIDFLCSRGYCGLSLYDSSLYSLKNFSVTSHQSNPNGGRLYANNFLFFPPFRKVAE